MKYWLLFKQSIKAIFSNKGRSFLTVLGIIIGIGSVIALVSMGDGVRTSVSDRIAKLGTTTIRVLPGQSRLVQGSSGTLGGSKSGVGSGQGAAASISSTTSTLTVTDLKSLSDTKTQPNLKSASGVINGTATVNTSSGEQRIEIQGTSVSFFGINNLVLEKGELFNQTDIDAKNKVIVLGSQVAADAFGADNPLGKTITINKVGYKVVGVLKKADENGLNNFNNNGYIPYSSAMVSFNNENFSTIVAQAKNDNSVDGAKNDIQKTLIKNHNITDEKLADFSVLTSKDLLSAVGNVTGILTSLLAGIAAISLVVGGIGIMNIMLVAVTERTREIGLRKAVGAKTRDIMFQFISETVLLTLVGGIFGIILGILVAKIVSPYIGFTPIISLSAILLAVGVSSAVGLIFGIYPAAKAARLNPIDALRYE